MWILIFSLFWIEQREYDRFFWYFESENLTKVRKIKKVESETNHSNWAHCSIWKGCILIKTKEDWKVSLYDSFLNQLKTKKGWKWFQLGQCGSIAKILKNWNGFEGIWVWSLTSTDFLKNSIIFEEKFCEWVHWMTYFCWNRLKTNIMLNGQSSFFCGTL